MPVIPVGAVSRRHYTSTLVDAFNQKATMTVTTEEATVTEAELQAIAAAVAAASNAAEYQREYSTASAVSIGNVTPFDEAAGSVTTKAIFRWQNNAGRVRTITVPAPDVSMFIGGNTQIIDDTHARSAAIISAGNTVFQKEDATYSYIGGMLSTRTRKTVSAPPRAQAAIEPAALDNPPPEPGA